MKKNTKFNLTKHKNGVLVDIAGVKKDIIALLAMAGYEDKNILDLLMDAVFASVALHMKNEHGIDLVEYLEAKMDQELSRHKPKERVVN